MAELKAEAEQRMCACVGGEKARKTALPVVAQVGRLECDGGLVEVVPYVEVGVDVQVGAPVAGSGHRV